MRCFWFIFFAFVVSLVKATTGEEDNAMWLKSMDDVEQIAIVWIRM